MQRKLPLRLVDTLLMVEGVVGAGLAVLHFVYD
jgi:hypothetical protein